MSYVESNLTPNEKLVYETRLHWIVMLGHLFTAFLLFVLGVVVLYYAQTATNTDQQTVHALQGGGIFLLCLAAVVVFMGILRRRATEIAVTNRRLVVKTGIASRKTIEMLLNKIESIEVKETTVGRVLGYGTIAVIGTGGTMEPFPRIARPLEFRSQVQQQIEKPA
jgi:uncharacterized membrane protein YdbT with pleckstrin-like domain